MRPTLCFSIMATALVAVACVFGPDRAANPDNRRLDAMEQAFALRATEPAAAARLFAEAGAGSYLERARLEAWLDCLDRFRAEPGDWRSVLTGTLPTDLESKARAGLGRALLDRRQVAAAVEVLEHRGAGLDGWEVMLEAPDPEIRERAARQLAVASPSRLRRFSRELEASALAELDPEHHLSRAAHWRQAGAASQAASELRGLRWRGEVEERRKLELARCEVATGRPARALRLLPSGRRATAEALLVRATAYRRQAWQRFPKANARSAFARCLSAARQAIAATAGEPAIERAANQLVVECATETGDLDEAVQGWWAIAATGTRDTTEEWIGRRLGVALAVSGGDPTVISRMARTLPRQERCLRYWVASSSAAPEAGLSNLADTPLADLYALWARRETGMPPPSTLDLPPAVGAGEPPAAVRWLLEHAGEAEASREWQRIRRSRGTAPREGMAAALFELERGRANRAIRVLRATFPELGTVSMAKTPEDAIRAYLPLGWPQELSSAAREVGLDPWLLAGLARQESVFVAHARSPRGAIGVLQLIPDTARLHSRALGLGGRPDLTDPAVNLRLGAHELAALIADLGAVEPALAAYNAGKTRARRWLRQWPDRRRFTEAVPIPETYTYIRRVIFLAESYRLVYGETWRDEG